MKDRRATIAPVDDVISVTGLLITRDSRHKRASDHALILSSNEKTPLFTLSIGIRRFRVAFVVLADLRNCANMGTRQVFHFENVPMKHGRPINLDELHGKKASR